MITSGEGREIDDKSYPVCRREVLDNGLRVFTSTMGHTHSASISIFVGAGSRYETAEKAGISHFLEHVCFKGTARRPTAREIFEAIDGVGGILNGGTDKELTVYWSKVASNHLPLALDILTELIRHPKFDAQEMEKEKQVVIDEINLGHDSPQHQVSLLIDEMLWPAQPLGRSVAGNAATVSSFTRSDILDYFSRQYTPTNTVVSIAGDINHDEVMAILPASLKDWGESSPLPWYPADDKQDTPHLCIEPRETDQSYLCLGVKGLPLNHPDRFSLNLLNAVLGEGMSSRLSMEIREKRGLAYSIYSYTSHFRDSGCVIVSAGTAPEHFTETIAAILQELRLLKEGVSDDELTKAKEMCKGQLILQMENSQHVANWSGVQELLLGNVLSVEEILKLIDSVQQENLKRVARQLLVTEKLNLAIVGSSPPRETLESMLHL